MGSPELEVWFQKAYKVKICLRGFILWRQTKVRHQLLRDLLFRDSPFVCPCGCLAQQVSHKKGRFHVQASTLARVLSSEA